MFRVCSHCGKWVSIALAACIGCGYVFGDRDVSPHVELNLYGHPGAIEVAGPPHGGTAVASNVAFRIDGTISE
jgi:hypothetical protein